MFEIVEMNGKKYEQKVGNLEMGKGFMWMGVIVNKFF
jgi:hypothetical protein